MAEAKVIVLLVPIFSVNAYNPDRYELWKILENFETLSALFLAYDYEDTFIIDDAFFADEFKKENQKLLMKVNNENIGEKVMLIYVDMYGNEFKEIIQLGGDSNE